MRYATIGTSWITESFIQGAEMVKGMELSAIYSRDLSKGEEFAKKTGVEIVFTDLQELATNELVNAIYIASPNSLHYEQSKLFLEYGKHVICEKPITVTPEELSELFSIADEKGLIYMEAIMMPHLPARKVLKNAMERIGNIYSAHLDFSQLSSKYDALQKGELPNIFNPKLATGCLMDLGVYCVYGAIDLFGEPKEILSSSGFLSTGSDAYGTSIFVYEDKQVTLTYSKIGQGYNGSEILGDKGSITLDSISRLANIRLIKNDGNSTLIWGEDTKPMLMRGEAQSFYNYVTDYSKNIESYRNSQELALKVSKAMGEIRTKAGISFE